MDYCVEVGERFPKGFVEATRAGLVRRHVRLRRMVEEIVCEEFLEDVEVPLALDFLGVPPPHRLRRVARCSATHMFLLLPV